MLRGDLAIIVYVKNHILAQRFLYYIFEGTCLFRNTLDFIDITCTIFDSAYLITELKFDQAVDEQRHSFRDWFPIC